MLVHVRQSPPTALRYLPGLVVVIAWTLALVHVGVAGEDLIKYAFRLAAGVLLPGVLLGRVIRTHRRPAVEDLAVGFAFGCVLQVPIWWACLRLGTSYWWWPVLVLIGVMIVPAARRRVLAPDIHHVPLRWSAAVATVCLIALAWLWGDFLRWTPADPGDGHTYYGDLIFHLSVAAEAKHAVPPTLPQVAGDPLYYHWLAHLDMGLASQLTGIELSTVTFQLWVPTMVLAGVVIVAACASRISGQLAVGPLTVVLIYAVGEVGLASWNVSTFLPMTQFYSWASPTQTVAAALTLPAVGVIIDHYRGVPGSGRQLGLLGVPLFVGLALAKSAVLPVLIGAAVLALLVVVLRHQAAVLGRALVVASTLLVVFAGCVAAVYGGQGGGLLLAPLSTIRRYTQIYLGSALDPSPGATALTAGVAVGVILVVWLIVVLGRVWGILLVVRRWRTLDLGLVFLIGGLVSGLAAYLALVHPGGSQIYFLISAFPLGAMASAWALSEYLPRSVLGCCVVAVTTALAALAVWLWMPFGLPRPGGGLVNELTFITRPATVVVGAAAALAAVLALLHRRGRARRVHVATLITAAVVAAGATTTLEYTFASLPSTGVARSKAQAPTSLATLTTSDVAAARWLREHTPPDTVLATNRHCLDGHTFPGLGPRPTRCDVLSFWISAWTERRVLVEGWGFGHKAVELEKQNGMTYKRQPFWNQPLLKANDGFFASPTRGEADVLCSYGAEYAFLDRRFQPNLPELDRWALRVYSNANVEIYQLPC